MKRFAKNVMVKELCKWVQIFQSYGET